MLYSSHLHKSFGDHDVLRDVSFEVSAGQRIGLVGANGVGKSTILKVILGTVEADSGSVRILPRSSVAYLPQDANCESDATLHQEMLTAFQDILSNEAHQRALEQEMNELTADDTSRLTRLVESHARLQEEFERLGGYEVETQIGIVLDGLGFSRADYDKTCRTFSGGWQMRIALAKLLLQKPQLLLLDEPTNHLDLSAIEWLESFLRDFQGALIVVSHDRYFLDRVTQRTLELENGQIREWGGNYSFYVAAKAAMAEQQKAAFERQQAHLKQQEAFIERFRASARRSAQAKSREKMLAKIEEIDLPRTGRGIHFRFPRCRVSGREVLALERATKSYGDHTIFANCDLTIQRGDRIALIGENGAGKTTLLRLLVGEESPDTGHRRVGHNVQDSYFAQHQADSLNVESDILDEIYEAAPSEWTLGDVRDLLGKLLFSGDTVYKQIGVLSGGERSRVALAKMLLRPANLLLLDEPTNHLDISAREMLETALKDYDGTVVVVSHDRYFISQIANRIVEVDRGKVRSFDGDYNYYREIKEKEKAEQAENARSAAAVKNIAPTTKPSRTRQPSHAKLLAAVEQEITTVEQAVAEMEKTLSDPSLYTEGERVKETLNEYNATKAHLEELNTRWEELAIAVEAEKRS